MRLPEDLPSATEYFRDPHRSLIYALKLRFPGAVDCPRCGGGGPTLIASRAVWHCRNCGKRFSVLSLTLAGRSHLPPGKWLLAGWYMANASEHLGARKLSKALGVSRRSAERILRLTLHIPRRPLEPAPDARRRFEAFARRMLASRLLG